MPTRILVAPIVVSALFGAASAVAADVLPLTAAQKKNLGVATVAAATQTASPALTYPARVTLPPASVRVIAAAGAGLVTQLHVQAGDTVKRGAPLVTLSMPGLADAQNRACAQRNPRCSRHAPASWRRRLRCRCWGRARCQAVRSR